MFSQKVIHILQMHKISIIIPVYNVQKYIGRCLESIFKQECLEVAIECILVDDCSSDKSMVIAERMVNGYKRRGGTIQFKMLRLPENKGHCAARNAAISIASGDYYLFVDSDDYLKQGSVKYFVDELDSVDRQPEVIMANAFSCYDKRRLSKIPQKQFIDNSNYEGLNLILNRILVHSSWNKLVKANVFTEYGLYFSEGIINEDLLWSYMLFLHASNILLLPRITYFYDNNNQQSITKTETYSLKFIRSRLFICNQILSNPPRIISPDYFGYVFCILHKAVDVFECHIDASNVNAERNGIRQLKHNLLHSTWRNGYPLLCCLFLTTYKPFYYIVKLKSFRIHFIFIIRTVVAASRRFHF